MYAHAWLMLMVLNLCSVHLNNQVISSPPAQRKVQMQLMRERQTRKNTKQQKLMQLRKPSQLQQETNKLMLKYLRCNP